MDIPEWMNDLPDELKESKNLIKFKSKEDLAKSYIEAEKKIGGSISLPKDENDEEGYNRILKRLGLPESIDGYEHPDGIDDATKALLSEVALKSGLTKKQYKALAKTLTEKQRTVVEEGLNRTKSTLKGDYDKVDKILEDKFPDIKVALHKSGLVADTAFMKSFSDIVKQFDEDKPVDGVPKPKQKKDVPHGWMYEYFNTGGQ